MRTRRKLAAKGGKVAPDVPAAVSPKEASSKASPRKSGEEIVAKTAADQQTDQPVDQPASQPIDQPADQPVDQPVDQPAEEPASVRRSGRTRKAVSYKEISEGNINREVPVTTTTPPAKRRRKEPADAADKVDAIDAAADGEPKAKRNATKGISYSEPEDVSLEDVLKKLDPEEAKEFEGWVELESEPAQFNYILHELGVKGVRVHEMVSFDAEELLAPAYGFIFLFQADEHTWEPNEAAIARPEGVWYSNQIASNSCASVALLNILMNGKDVELGDKLQKFKQLTADLIPPHRGDHLARDALIRTTHNSFARRLDLLSEDILLQNNLDDSKKKVVKTKSRKSTKASKAAAGDARPQHYVAYVPVDGKLWELDGLDAGAICLGEYEGNWAAAALPLIYQKALSYGLNATLMAMCHSPVESLRAQIAQNIASLVALQEETDRRDGWEIFRGDQATWVDGTNDADLAELGLTAADIINTAVDPAFLEGISPRSDLTAKSAMELAATLEEVQRQLKSEYREENTTMQESIDVGKRRRMDFTPAIHTWINKLAGKGKLQALGESG